MKSRSPLYLLGLVTTSALVLASPPNRPERLPLPSEGGVFLPPGVSNASMAAGEILIKFRSLTDATEIERDGRVGAGRRPGLAAALERHGVRGARRPFARVGFRRLDRVVAVVSERARRDPGRLRDVLASLRARPEVEYAEPNVTLQAFFTPDDPYFGSAGAWGQDFADLWGLHKMGASGAWDRTRGAGVVVAVVDTGLDFSHPELVPNLWQNPGETGLDALSRDKRSNGLDDDGNGFVDDWRGWDFAQAGPGDNDPTDLHGHGTHVAGTIAAVGNNGAGVVGVAPEASVMGVRVLDAGGSGSLEAISNGILYAANAGARVINASFGGSGETPQTLVDAIAYAHDVKGVVFVAAAGNSNLNVGPAWKGTYPANIRDALTVAAYNHLDQKASFSNFGSKLDVAAPGGGDSDPTATLYEPQRSILSLKAALAGSSMTGSGQLVVNEKYLRQAGTSMAAPHVAGLAALVLAQNPGYSPEQVRQAIRRGADDLGAPGFDTQSGYGRTNADRATSEPPPLAAQLTDPARSFVSLTPAAVVGVVGGPDLLDWTLEYGVGAAPSVWLPVATGVTAVANQPLGTFPSGRTDGTYMLRLSARNTRGVVYADRMEVLVDSLSITSPSQTDEVAVTSGSPIAVHGTVAPAGFTSYSMTVTGARGGPLPSPRLTLANGGTQTVVSGLIGTWDTTGAPADHYSVCVRLNSMPFTSECTKVLVDPSLRPGWPRNLGMIGSGGFTLALVDHLTAADVDGDGAQDLPVAYGSSVHVFDAEGNDLPGWPQNVDPGGIGAIIQYGPAVGDLTGDGLPEVVARNNQGNVFVWQSDGTLLPGWPKRFSNYGHVAVDDLDGDGRREIVVTGSSILVMDANGLARPGWPRSFPHWLTNSPAIGDVDGDGRKELVVKTVTGSGAMYVYRADGTLAPGWPQNVDPDLGASYGADSEPVLGDLDGDGASEIVVGGHDGRVLAYRGDGSPMPGWPQPTVPVPVNSPAIGDIDGDGQPEVVAGTEYYFPSDPLARGNFMYAWHADGTPVAGWPIRLNNSNYRFFGFGPPALADVDGDGKADVVASSDGSSSLFTLQAYRFDATNVGDFPRPTLGVGTWPTAMAAVADLDADGQSELAWVDSDFNLFVWNLSAPAAGPAPYPMFRGDAAHTGRTARSEFRLNLRLSGVRGGRGSVSVHPSGATCEMPGPGEATCVYAFAAGTAVTLVATPDPGGSQAWGVSCSGSDASCAVTLTDDRSVTVTFAPPNQAPTAAPGGPYTAYRGQPIVFDGSASSDPEGDALGYEWDFGDGGRSTGVSPTHTYYSLGTHAVTLVVSDGVLSSLPATTTATIVNRAPVANPGGPYVGDNGTGATISFFGYGSLDPDGDPLTFLWSFGDGTTGEGPAPQHTYAGAGSYTVSLTVSDGLASSPPAATTALIRDVVAPAAVTDLEVASVDVRTLTLRWTAPSDQGTTGRAVRYDMRYSSSPIDASNFGSALVVSGLPAPKPAGAMETFTVAGLVPSTVYYFALKAYDAANNLSGLSNVASGSTAPLVTIFRDDLEAGASNWTVAGSNGAGGPALWHLSTYRSASPSTSFYYGSEATRNYSTGARNYGSITSLPIDLAGAVAPRLAFQYFASRESSSTYDLARAFVSKDGGLSFTQLGGPLAVTSGMTRVSFDLKPFEGTTIRVRFDFDTVDAVYNTFEGLYVDDVEVTADKVVTPPLAAPGGPYAGLRRQPIAFDGSGSSSPRGGPLTYAWSFGDGTAGSGLSPTHAYTGAGSFTVSLVVNDGVAASRPATTTVTVTNRPPVSVAGGPYAGVEGGSPVAFDGRGSSDPDADPLTYTWSFGDGASGSGPTPARVYARGGVFPVTLTVSDGAASATSSTTATITAVPPAPVGDLAATATGPGSLRLNWTATGDDGSVGTATSYDLRYSTSPIDALSFATATQAFGEPTPRAAGAAESMTIAGLASETLYYLALKVADDSGEWSELSNVASAVTARQVVAFSDDMESGLASWTLTGSDGKGGPGLWHAGTHRFNSPTRALYYGLEPGHTYNTGAANAGLATSRSISLVGVAAPRLSFRHFLQREASASYDLARLLISTNGGVSWTLLATYTSATVMTLIDLDLAAYQGQTIQLRFSFDTVDSVANGYEGWVIDDVRITGQ
jgi:subtilisin family serine protease/PKD repeat protein